LKRHCIFAIRTCSCISSADKWSMTCLSAALSPLLVEPNCINDVWFHHVSKNFSLHLDLLMKKTPAWEVVCLFYSIIVNDEQLEKECETMLPNKDKAIRHIYFWTSDYSEHAWVGANCKTLRWINVVSNSIILTVRQVDNLGL